MTITAFASICSWDVWDLNAASFLWEISDYKLFFMSCPTLLLKELLRNSSFNLKIAVF